MKMFAHRIIAISPRRAASARILRPNVRCFVNAHIPTDPVSMVRNGPVATIIINRPQCRNAIDGVTATKLTQLVREFENDESLKVGVLWGVGNFCAGADLKAIRSGTGCVLSDDGDGPLGPSRIQLAKPIIAAVSGAAVAGGLELAIWCDMRVVEEDAYFGVFCRNWGVPLIDGGTVRLPRLIGQSRALDMILTGRAVHAKEALEFGLANRVVPTGKSREAAEALALELAKLPQECMLSDRASVYSQFGYSVKEAMKIEFAGSKNIVDKSLLSRLQAFSGENSKNKG